MTVGPSDVFIEAAGGTVAGSTASDLRKCIDKANCPDSRLQAASRGNGDGRVDADEVDGFEDSVVAGLNGALAFGGTGGLADFGQQLRALVRIDDQGPTGVQIETLALANAAGAIASTAPIQVTFVLKVFFDTGKRGSHDVSVARTAADFDLADRIAVQPASGWKIPKGSVGPEALQARYDDGSLHGNQAEMQGAEPLTFRLTSDAGLPWWGWTLLALVVLGAAAGLLLYLRQRRGKA